MRTTAFVPAVLFSLLFAAACQDLPMQPITAPASSSLEEAPGTPEIQSGVEFGLGGFADLEGGGRKLRVNGGIFCVSPGEKVRLNLTVTQASTEARGETTVRITCSGGGEGWVTTVSARGPARFELGEATGCLALTSSGGGKGDERCQPLVIGVV